MQKVRAKELAFTRQSLSPLPLPIWRFRDQVQHTHKGSEGFRVCHLLCTLCDMMSRFWSCNEKRKQKKTNLIIENDTLLSNPLRHKTLCPVISVLSAVSIICYKVSLCGLMITIKYYERASNRHMPSAALNAASRSHLLQHVVDQCFQMAPLISTMERLVVSSTTHKVARLVETHAD